MRHDRQRVHALQAEPEGLVCTLAAGEQVRLPVCLGSFLRPGHELEYPAGSATPRQFSVSLGGGLSCGDLLFCQIRHVGQPKADRRGAHFLRGDVVDDGLGIASLMLPAEAVRDYFYRLPNGGTLYSALGVAPDAAPVELRLAYRLAALELIHSENAGGRRRDIERAFNILAQPDLRACHDAATLDPDKPVLFPYGGCGSILVTGRRPPGGSTFFAVRILFFRPECCQRRFRAAFRRIEFFDGYAVFRDTRRKREVLLDPAVLPLTWDCTWNQWKHLTGARIGIEATLVRSVQYRYRGGQWNLKSWETALPSRVSITVPENMQQLLDGAQLVYQRFGWYYDGLAPLKARIEHAPVERAEIDEHLGRLHVPGDFDPAMLTWRPDYEEFYYRELKRHSRRLYLFRHEYIFEWEQAAIVEVPEAGHATYVFRRPDNFDGWLRAYSAATRDDIRNNRCNIAETLGFVGRVMHGQNRRTWFREVTAKAGIKSTRAGNPAPGPD